MRLLLDTHLLLWIAQDSPRLSAQARGQITAAEAVYFSVATIWEIAIKSRLGKLKADVKRVAELAGLRGLIELPVYSRHAVVVGSLPLHHGDPFDRLLVGQAIADQMTLLTADRQLAAYGPHVLPV
jgi:PIN domain nuclease of toxin-antitoxin system